MTQMGEGLGKGMTQMGEGLGKMMTQGFYNSCLHLSLFKYCSSSLQKLEN
jgi:hypothetical protein